MRFRSPGQGTPFGVRLDGLRALVAAATLSIDALPACRHLDRSGTVDAVGGVAQVPPRERNAYPEALSARTPQRSGHAWV